MGLTRLTSALEFFLARALLMTREYCAWASSSLNSGLDPYG